MGIDSGGHDSVRQVPVAPTIDIWYAALTTSVVIDLFSTGMPAGMRTTGYVPFDGLEEIAAHLQLGDPQRIVDLGCGIGWPGLWMARSLGSSLVGIDYSAAAVAAAAGAACIEFPDVDAEFVAADATRTPLTAGMMDAVVSLDVAQLVADRSAFYEEVVRVIRPGGLAVISTWQASGSDDAARYPRDLAGELTEAGLKVEAVHERPAWVEHQTSVYELALAAEQDHPDDGPLKRLVAEAKSFFANPQRRRRLLSVSRRPQ